MDRDDEEETPEEDSFDENDGFLVDRSIHDLRRDQLQEVREETRTEVGASQGRTNEKGI
jgi:hypothetical protein